jgi:heterogeneous nuclear ribonucleoprotein A1/A3
MGKKRKLESKPTAAAKAAAAAKATAAAKIAEPAALTPKPETLAEFYAPSAQTAAQKTGSTAAATEEKPPQELGGEEDEWEEVEVEEEVDEEEPQQQQQQQQAEDEGESDPASIQALLEAFPKEQLVELLRDAAVGHGDVLAAVRVAADADPAQRKIFVHGLGWDTTVDTLKEAFSSYGEIEDLKLVSDRSTGKCKGYGFILFRRRAGARAALLEPQKKIGNRTTSCQLASVGPVSSGGAASNPMLATSPAPAPPALILPPVSEYTQRKIFVSNVGAEIDPQKLMQFFSKYGEIEEGPLGLDKATGKPKGFALFVYKTLDGAKKALQEPHKSFEGVMLHCQKAIDGPKPNKGGGYGAASTSGRKGAAGYGASSHSLPGSVGAGYGLSSPASLGSLPGGAPGAPGMNPVFGQALTAFLANQGTGLGLNNILGAGPNGSGLPNSGSSGALGGGGVPGMPGGYMGYGGGGGYGGPPAGGPGRNYMGH